MKELLQTITAWRAEGVEVCRAVVVRTFGSAPRPEGAAMLATSDGRIAGSVSGGCVEGAVFEEIRRARATGHSRVIRYGISDEQAWDVGLACGGTVDVLIEPTVSEAVEAPPKRIVIAGKALFMVADVAYLFPEASSRIVALGSTVQNKLSFASVVDPAYSAKTILDGSAGAEQIAATNPDVVLLKSSNATTLGQPLAALGVKVVYVDFETPDQYTRDLTTLGLLFGDTAKAQQLISYFEVKTNSVTTALAGIADAQKPKVLVLYYSSKNGTVAFNVPPLSFIQSTEVQLAGGQLVWKDAQLGSSWTTVTLEQIAAWNPDQVYVIAYSGSSTDVVTTLKADPQWQALTAVKQNAIYAFPADYYSWDQPDPRWVLGLAWLAAKIHPDQFANFSIDTVTRSFYRDLYGMDDATYDKLVKPNLAGSF